MQIFLTVMNDVMVCMQNEEGLNATMWNLQWCNPYLRHGSFIIVGRRATVAPLSWKERSRRQLLETERAGAPPPAFSSAYVSSFPSKLKAAAKANAFLWDSTLTVHCSNELTCL